MHRRLIPASLALALATLSPAALAAGPTLEDLQKQIDALAAELEAQKSTKATGSSKTTLGGYGEHHYNNLDSKREVDAHRFVLFIGHQFDEKIRLFSELEVEHGFVKDNNTAAGGTTSPGEVELEQAYIEFTLSDSMRVKAGQFLLPVGFLNETHEPDTFYGVERNPIENAIIPTTWWETGVMLSGEAGEMLGYDLAVHSGLNSVGANAGNVRNGRQKSASARANELAVTARVKFRPMEGLELAATAQHQDDIAQETLVSAQEAMLVSAQFSWQLMEKLNLRGLYGEWDIENLANGRQAQNGWYLETSYRLLPKLGVFARHNEWDNVAANATNSVITQTDLGVNWWPHERVVVKADYQQREKTSDDDGFNLGLGWSF